jgi:hypothetical protein
VLTALNPHLVANSHTYEKLPMSSRSYARVPATGTPVYVWWIRTGDHTEEFDPPLRGEIIGQVGERIEKPPACDTTYEALKATAESHQNSLQIYIPIRAKTYGESECGWSISALS